MSKTLSSQDGNGVQKNVKDVTFFGNPDGFQLICKASSESEGWMKSTKAMEIPGVGCLVQVTTQQRNGGIYDKTASYSIAESLTFVPKIRIYCHRNDKDEIVGRELVSVNTI